MQRGEKDFATKASVNAEKNFFNDFLGYFGEKKKLRSDAMKKTCHLLILC